MTANPTDSGSSHRQAAPGPLDLIRKFVNTVEFDEGVDRFDTPVRLAEWLESHGLLASGAAVTEADRARAVEVREALRSLCLANNGEPLDPSAVQTLRAAADAAPVLIRPDPAGPALEPAVGGVPGALATLLAVVHAAMLEGTWQRLKTCPADDCLWAFYDRSRNRSGHWCSMASCGNRAKARNYRERRRGGAS